MKPLSTNPRILGAVGVNADRSIRRSPRFEDIRVGDRLPELERGPMTALHLMRWSSAIENWHRIHYDVPFATEHDELPDLLINGSWKQHFLVQVVRDWLGPDGWLVKISFSFRAMDLVGSTLTAWGGVTETFITEALGYVRLEIGIRNQDGQQSTPGIALGVLPLVGGRPVPYPYPDTLGHEH